MLEERGQHQIAEDGRLAERVLHPAPQQAPLPVGDLLAGLADAPAEGGDLLQVLAHPHDLEAGLELRRIPLPVERLDLRPGEADQGVAVPQGVVQEGERVVLGQGGEPQRQLGEVHGHGVAVHAVEATLGDQATGEDHFVLVGRDLGHRVMRAPRLDQRIGELPAGLDQEGAGAHRRIADLEVEDPFGPGRFAPSAAQSAQNRSQGRAYHRLRGFPAHRTRGWFRRQRLRRFQGRAHHRLRGFTAHRTGGRFRLQRLHRFQGRAHDGSGQFAGGVVRAGAPPLLARLQHHGPGGHQIRRRVPVDDRIKGGVQRLDTPRLPHRLLHPVGELAVGTVLDPLRAPGRRFAQQRFDVHGGGGAVLLRGPDGGGAPRRRLQPEAHHGFVDGADVLDVQGAVGDALAVQDDELLKHPVDGAVGDERRLDPLVDLPGAALRAAFQEAVAIGVEQGAVARRQRHAARAGAVMDHAEQDEKLRIRTVALVHGVRVQGRVFAQPLVQAGQRVGAEEGVVLRQHVPLLGVEQEDEAQHEGEQTPVDIVRVRRQRLGEERALRGVVRGLEAAQQLVEGVQHLFGQALAHLVLELAAVRQQAGEALRARHGEEPGFPEQQTHGGGDGAARALAHVRHPEVEPAGAFAARRGDEAEREAVEEEAGRHAGVAEQSFHTPVGRGFQAAAAVAPASAATRRAVEVLARPADLDEKLPAAGGAGNAGFVGGGRPVRRRALADAGKRLAGLRRRGRAGCGCGRGCGPRYGGDSAPGGRDTRAPRDGPRRGNVPHRFRAHREVGTQNLPGIRQRCFELGGNRRLVRAGVPFRGEVPAEHGGGEGAEVRQPGLRLLLRAEAALLGALAKQPLPLGVAPVEDRARPHERRGGDDEPGGPDEAEPFEVGGDVGVGLRHAGRPLLRNQQRDDAPSRLPIDVEVAVERHDRRVVGAFDEPHETGIGERHRHVGVLPEQPAEGARVVRRGHTPRDLKHTSFGQRHRQAGIGADTPQQKRRLGDDRLTGEQRRS